jgi:hypothetical protein
MIPAIMDEGRKRVLLIATYAGPEMALCFRAERAGPLWSNAGSFTGNRSRS